ncbi:hypothetical protein [Ensifer sp. SL37]|uniref:hypothetical protein n=1 Tax=Ensifer sp. SL37 TaxID=2995137 RepID=UPI0022725AFF|nr:hypothetical protein [Ensifer sp. SL37]MCY1741189.1 hypothetical protein [Ensifer sp. SL37]
MNDRVLLDAVHANRRAMASVADRLEDIASLLGEVGMERLETRIMEAVDDIIIHSKRVSDAFGEDLNQSLRQSQEMTGTILLGLLKKCA